MSYNVGVYTSPSGAETAFAGQVIASATWNSINTDYATALNQIGYPSGVGNPRVVVSLSNGATDTLLSVPVLPGFNRYRVSSLVLSGSGGINISPGSVALYTAAGGGGITIIGSTTLTIIAADGTNNSIQILTPSQANTLSLTASVLYLRVLVSTSGIAQASLFVQPL
jgi:hypothetical protein